jgi:serine phosphatase RsbU (regulator of sigma subunit)/uncharacterized protein HemY
MKKIINYFCICICAFSSFLLHAEKTNKNIDPNKTIDSLLTALKTVTTDTGKVQLLNALSGKYSKISNYEEALKYATEAKTEAQKIDYQKGLANAYYNIGSVSSDQGNYEKAFDNQLKALKIREELNNVRGMADSYNSLGIIYDYQKNYTKALELYSKALKIYETIADKTGMANMWNNTGIIYDDQKNYSKALEQYFKSLKIYEETGDKEGVATAYNNIGYLYMKQGNYQNGLSNYLKASKISEQIGDKQATAMNYNNIGETYTVLNKFEDAHNYLTRSLALSLETGSKDDIKEAYSSLSELYDKQGDYKKAYDYHKLFSDIKDTLLSAQSGKQIAEMDAKYESEKKEKNIELLTKDKALQDADLNKQKFIRNGFIGGLIIALLLAFIFYNRYVIKQKLNTELSSKNNELVQKNVLIEKQKEKIIDSITYAQLIQQSILMEESEIQKSLPDSFIYYQPKDIVSGDFYWFSEVTNSSELEISNSESNVSNFASQKPRTVNSKLLIAAIDCTGHGVPGAFMSMIGNTLLNQIVNEKHITKPSEILRLLNIGIYESLHQQKDETLSRDGMDVALCCIDFNNNQIEYAGAKNPLYLISDNTLTIIKGDKETIGGGGLISKQFMPLEREYTNHIIPIKKDMSIYIFTDGYMDQFENTERKKFGTQKFKELLLNNQQLSMKQQKDVIVKAHQDWKGSTAQIDDILVIGLRL